MEMWDQNGPLSSAGFRGLAENAAAGVLVAELDGTILYAGASTEESLGLLPQELVQQNLFELVHPDDVGRIRSAVSADCLPNGRTAYEEFRAIHSKGAWRWLGASIRNLVHDPEIGGLVFNLHDVSRRKQFDDQESTHRVLFDKLTGLPNRVLLEDRIERARLTAARTHEPLALVLVNIDRFRDVNDALGYTIGDMVLGMVSKRLGAALRTSDTFARLIGDEFVALLLSSDDISAVTVAERIEAAFEEPFLVDRQPIALGATLGIAFYPDHGKDAEELLRHADVALQNARALRLPCAVYHSDDDLHRGRRLTMRAELRTAIAEDGLVQYYQPKRGLRSGSVDEVEALARWDHPAHGFVPPSEFIPLAERWNAIKPLTLWALRTAIQQAKSWQESGLPLTVSVNLSARDLHDQDLPGAVSEMLSATGLESHSLMVEVTEGMLMMDPERARFVLDQLRALGVRISVDDFGTGYSSLAYLSRLPLDELKIDSSFIAAMGKNERDRLIVATTIELGHRLGLTMVAEGVEDQASEELLRAMNCDAVQGYYISAPLPTDELMRWLGQQQ